MAARRTTTSSQPTYVPITALSEAEKARYRARYLTARGRFDLYLLFFRGGITAARAGGRLVFITPRKYLYVETAGPTARLLARWHIEEIRLVREDTFGDLVDLSDDYRANPRCASMTRIVGRKQYDGDC